MDGWMGGGRDGMARELLWVCRLQAKKGRKERRVR
jgi:hypothetical protein